MKSKLILSVLGWFTAASMFAATNELSSFLQRGLLEEEANHNLDAAISAYRSAVAQFDKERQLAATAIYRLGESLRKQGRGAEAISQFERIVREFPEQTQLVELSRQNLASGKSQQTTQPVQNEIAAGAIVMKSSDAQFEGHWSESMQYRPVATGDGQTNNQFRSSLTPDDSSGTNDWRTWPGAYGTSYKFISKGKLATATYQPTIPAAGLYHIDIWYAQGTNRAVNSPWLISCGGQKQVILVNQQINGGHWFRIASDMPFEAGKKDFVQLSNDGISSGVVVADGVRFVPVNAAAESREVSRRDGNASDESPDDDVARAETKWINELKRKIKDSPDLLNAEGGKELHDAARIGHTRVAQFLLDNGADVNVPDSNGNTPLHFAADAGRKTMVELLLARGANVNAKNKGGGTPLTSSANQGFKTVAEVLLANGADVNVKGSQWTTPLHVAAGRGYLPFAQLLIAHKAEVNAKDNNERTPLFSAIAEARTEMVRLLLTNKADVNATAKSGWTPLLDAIARRNVEAVKVLLQNGANTEAQIDKEPGSGMPSYLSNCRPLPLALFQDNDEMVKLLLDSGANPNAKIDHRGLGNEPVRLMGNLSEEYPPLMLAITRSRDVAAKLLLEHGADPNLTDRSGRTSLHMAVGWNQKKIVELLLAHHANVNALDGSGAPPIGYAKDKPEILELLRRAGADENFARLPWIFVGRKSVNYSDWVFFKGSNSLNHHTLFETIAVHYSIGRPGPVPNGFPFPDFAHVNISRILPGGKTQDIPLDLDLAFRTGDCSQDLPLQFGDIVQIPEADHGLTENWTGLPSPIRDALNKCLERHVEIIVKGKSTKVKLLAPIYNYSVVPPQFAPSLAGTAKEEKPTTLSTFWLNAVLRGANVLLTSSDLTRVKIKRTDPVTKKTSEFIFNPSAVDPNSNVPDLWLEDGDVIEVPERDPNAPAATVPGPAIPDPGLREIKTRTLRQPPQTPK